MRKLSWVVRTCIFFLMGLKVAQGGLVVQGPPLGGDFHYTYLESTRTDQVFDHHVQPRSYFLNSQYSYIDHPLIEASSSGSRRNIVNFLHMVDLRAGVLLSEKLSVSFNLSFTQVSPVGENSRLAFGHSVAQLKYRLTDKESLIQWALVPEVYIPLNGGEDYTSTSLLGSAFRLSAETSWRSFNIIGNLGYRSLPENRWRNVDYSQQAIAGLGVQYPLTARLSLVGESAGYIAVPFKKENSVAETYGGVLWQLSSLSSLSGGIGLSDLVTEPHSLSRIVFGYKTYFSEPPKRNAPAKLVKSPVCEFRKETVEISPRSLTASELQAFRGHLPYRESVQVYSKYRWTHIRTRTLFESDRSTADSHRGIENSQIPFAFDFTKIREIKSFKQITQAVVKVAYKTFVGDGFPLTETICSLDLRQCSGTPIGLKHWRDTLNLEYFSSPLKTINANFSQKLENQARAVSPKTPLIEGEFQLSFDELLEGGGESSSDLIQRGQMRPLYFAVADDTKLRPGTSLILTVVKEECHPQ